MATRNPVSETLEEVVQKIPEATGSEFALIKKKMRFLVEFMPPIVTYQATEDAGPF